MATSKTGSDVREPPVGVIAHQLIFHPALSFDTKALGTGTERNILIDGGPGFANLL